METTTLNDAVKLRSLPSVEQAAYLMRNPEPCSICGALTRGAISFGLSEPLMHDRCPDCYNDACNDEYSTYGDD